MPKYKVISPVKHDGESVELGAAIELSEKEAKDLLAAKVIEPYTISVPTDPSARIGAIKDAIATLDTTNKDNWLQSGAPDLAAIEGALGWSPTAAERDAAWEEMKG